MAQPAVTPVPDLDLAPSVRAGKLRASLLSAPVAAATSPAPVAGWGEVESECRRMQSPRYVELWVGSVAPGQGLGLRNSEERPRTVQVLHL